MAEATTRPWLVEDRRGAALKNIRVVAGAHEVCWLSDVHQRDYQGSFRGDHKAADELDSVGLANAALIVRAVNCYDDLLAALKALHAACHWADAPDEMDQARAAIAKAESK